jgi:hypothetical protein
MRPAPNLTAAPPAHSPSHPPAQRNLRCFRVLRFYALQVTRLCHTCASTYTNCPAQLAAVYMFEYIIQVHCAACLCSA